MSYQLLLCDIELEKQIIVVLSRLQCQTLCDICDNNPFLVHT